MSLSDIIENIDCKNSNNEIQEIEVLFSIEYFFLVSEFTYKSRGNPLNLSCKFSQLTFKGLENKIKIDKKVSKEIT